MDGCGTGQTHRRLQGDTRAGNAGDYIDKE
jgi:hypothetical protein